MKKPNFFIIGAARAGTTSLYYYLQQHPDIYMSPNKEPRFFAFEGQNELVGAFGVRKISPYSNNWNQYLKLFEKAANEKAVGEASTLYLYHHKAPAKIHSRIPDAKLIAILRNPVERALSHYLYNIRRGGEPCSSFEEAVAAEEDRIKMGWAPYFHYRPMGRYAEQIERYFNFFPPDQLRIYLYEDMAADSLGVVKDIFKFLAVNSEFVPNVSVVYNPSGKSKISFISKVLKRQFSIKSVTKRFIPKSLRSRISEWEQWRNVKPISKPSISPEFSKDLIDYYSEDILRLQEMIGRDLCHWLKMEDYR
ncbi:MAG: sulfotransferase [Desulfobacterales bacterium]